MRVVALDARIKSGHDELGMKFSYLSSLPGLTRQSRHRPRIAVLIAALLLTLLPNAASAEGDAVAQLIDQVNRTRIAHGLKPLTPEARLTAAAKAHADAMASGDCFAHVCDGGPTLVERIVRVGYPYRTVAENLAAGMARAEAVVKAWMASPGHRRNLLLPDIEEAGVGYVLRENDGGQHRYRHYWTMTFGARL